MLFDLGMKYANDNERLSFISLAALTANVVRLLEKQVIDGQHDADAGQRHGIEDADEEGRSGLSVAVGDKRRRDAIPSQVWPDQSGRMMVRQQNDI